jgi:hypothetical protein
MEQMKNTHRVKAAADQAVRQRNYRRARERALTRLANAFPDIYRAYLEEEKDIDKNMGKKWLDIDGNTSLVNTRTQ